MKILSLTVLLFLTPITYPLIGMNWEKQRALQKTEFAVIVTELKQEWKKKLTENNILPFDGYTDDALIDLMYEQYSADIASMASDKIDISDKAEFPRRFLRAIMPNYNKQVLFCNQTIMNGIKFKFKN